MVSFSAWLPWRYWSSCLNVCLSACLSVCLSVCVCVYKIHKINKNWFFNCIKNSFDLKNQYSIKFYIFWQVQINFLSFFQNPTSKLTISWVLRVFQIKKSIFNKKNISFRGGCALKNWYINFSAWFRAVGQKFTKWGVGHRFFDEFCTFRKVQNSPKKVWPTPHFVNFYPTAQNPAEKFIYQFFKAQVTMASKKWIIWI